MFEEFRLKVKLEGEPKRLPEEFKRIMKLEIIEEVCRMINASFAELKILEKCKIGILKLQMIREYYYP